MKNILTKRKVGRYVPAPTYIKKEPTPNVVLSRRKENVTRVLKVPHLKGTVSRELRWVLLYINQKLFSRADVPYHKILIFIKGHFTIY